MSYNVYWIIYCLYCRKYFWNYVIL